MKVYLLWSEEDYYGPDLMGVYVTEAAADTARAALNAKFRSRRPGANPDWPYYIEEVEAEG